MKNIVIIGKVIDAYGIKGWVKVKPFTETPKNYTQYINQFVSTNQKDWEAITIKDVKIQGENVLLDLGQVQFSISIIQDSTQAIDPTSYFSCLVALQ